MRDHVRASLMATSLALVGGGGDLAAGQDAGVKPSLLIARNSAANNTWGCVLSTGDANNVRDAHVKSGTENRRVRDIAVSQFAIPLPNPIGGWASRSSRDGFTAHSGSTPLPANSIAIVTFSFEAAKEGDLVLKAPATIDLTSTGTATRSDGDLVDSFSQTTNGTIPMAPISLTPILPEPVEAVTLGTALTSTTVQALVAGHYSLGETLVGIFAEPFGTPSLTGMPPMAFVTLAFNDASGSHLVSSSIRVDVALSGTPSSPTAIVGVIDPADLSFDGRGAATNVSIESAAALPALAALFVSPQFVDAYTELGGEFTAVTVIEPTSPGGEWAITLNVTCGVIEARFALVGDAVAGLTLTLSHGP